jgi:hypothetical protein
MATRRTNRMRLERDPGDGFPVEVTTAIMLVL